MPIGLGWGRRKQWMGDVHGRNEGFRRIGVFWSDNFYTELLALLEEKRMKVSAYMRESSADTTKAPSIHEQGGAFALWVQENKYEEIKRYEDNGFSGGDWKRPSWNKLVKEARGHWFSALWVWSQDRIARDTEQFLWFYRNLKESGVKLYSHTEGWIDMETLGGRVQHTAIAMASEIFRITTSDKVKKKYEQKAKEAAKKGITHFWGRNKKSLPVHQIQSWRKEGKGYRAISKLLSSQGIQVSHITVRGALRNTPPAIQTENQHKKRGVKNYPIS